MWSKNIPKESGMYWAKMTKDHSPEILNIKMVAFDSQGNHFFVDCFDLWGPRVEPPEETDGNTPF